MVDPWVLLVGGRLFDAVIASYTNVMGLWFYMLVLMLGMIMIYIKTSNFGTTTITGMIIISGLLLADIFVCIGPSGEQVCLPTDSFWLAMILIALGITFILYKAFK